jgi:hypothetical protein
MQLELNLNQLKKSGTQIGMKSFQKLFVNYGMGKKTFQKKKTHLYPSSLEY